ncbi:sulfotransferase [Nocardioides jensenii]|uniref:sulfotransferase n=1 Tax=Nocardioides jensenii TaxID=1843 RepID=UPI0008330FFC|nr:sulfotransferase [Nocardioides jensenii]
MSPAEAPLLYIGGWGRSGSTLLECLLAELDDVVVLGEVVHLWERGLRHNERCACGQPFHACPFWSEVGERAFGGWSRVDPDRLAWLRHEVDRQRRIPQTGRLRPTPRTVALTQEYADHYRRIYDAARTITGATIVVDSSKEIPTALALSHDPVIDLRVLHIVRDSRGVAYSWSKTVTRPESTTAEPMQRYGPATSTAFWLSGNLTVKALAHRGVPLVRMRYEDLVDAPQDSVASAWRALGLPGAPRLPMLDEHTVDLHPTHSVAGNPMRFRTGRTTLAADTSWRESLPVRDRRLVTAMSYPVLRKWGYLDARTKEPA